MKMFRRVEDPAGRTFGSWALDTLIAVAAFGAALPVLFNQNHHGRAVGIVVLAVMVAPLLVRRIWPVPVFCWVLLISGAAGAVSTHIVAGLGLGVALYTVAELNQRRDALVAAGVLEVGMIVAAIKVAGGDWWFDAIFLSGMIAAALGLGLYAATRRAYLAELRDRAERLERERDQQGALAAAAERARIAREMHDVVAHHLTVMVALSDGAIAASAASPERAADVMRSVSATGRRALADTRGLLGVLRQPDDDPTAARQPVPDLSDLDLLIEGVRAAGLPTTLEVRGTPVDLPSGVQLTVYRLVQEALTNTLKHGGAGARASVCLHHLPGELVVEVDDDGAGSTAPMPVGVGGGLVGMQERVHAYGGDVASGPRDPGGWRVAARLSLDPDDEHR
jgi:signal transduction histidine kinase